MLVKILFKAKPVAMEPPFRISRRYTNSIFTVFITNSLPKSNEFITDIDFMAAKEFGSA